MDKERLAIIHVVNEAKELKILLCVGDTVETLCIKICKILEIDPITRHLFALRNYSSKIWYSLGHEFDATENLKLDFRLRFKPSNIKTLKKIDEQAYNYYFHQVRTDVMNSKVPDIVYEKHKCELIGLGVTDMYRVMLEQDISQRIVVSDYKKYIPKECVKKHYFFLKKPIQDLLAQFRGYSAPYVIQEYLNQFEAMAPNYPYEEYKVLIDNGADPSAKVLVRINITGVKYCETDDDTWKTICTTEELSFISIRQDSVKISRTNGIPYSLKFGSNAFVRSFISGLDGYYRLAISWIFNLCGDVTTPSLERLYKLKCHGPVGQEFSYAKLKDKRDNKPGTYIIRESEKDYNVYYIDACDKDGKILSQRVNESMNEFSISGSTQKYTSMKELISSFKDPTNPLYLAECLPPTEYDKSPLLLCLSEKIEDELLENENLNFKFLEYGPRFIPQNELLQVSKVKSNENLARTIASSTTVHRAMWQVKKGKKVEAAIKILKKEKWSYCGSNFLKLVEKWAKLRSGAIVRLYGMSVVPMAMLLELVKFGSLDDYLNNPPQPVRIVDMVEATSYLVSALWHLEQNHVVHGNIRCNKLLVCLHTEDNFIIKLADPGLFTYTEVDVPWIPPECYGNLELAKNSYQADTWAVGTTIWQIFSRGNSPPIYSDIHSMKKFYLQGRRLPKPKECSNEIYRLILDCWRETDTRKQPHAIMRDINQILYQIYNSRKTHAYTKIFPRLLKNSDHIDEDDFNLVETKSLDGESHASSLFTDLTSVAWDDVDEVMKIDSLENVSSTEEMLTYQNWLTDSVGSMNINDHANHALCTENVGNVMRLTDENPSGNSSGDASNSASINQMQIAYDLDEDYYVILQGRIGQGFYGEVYRGTIESRTQNGKDESQLVAVKKLKTPALETDFRDFEREIRIMKRLKHPNVVEILGATSEPGICLVMEFIKNGSLHNYLTMHGPDLTHKQLLGFALDIATGMDYLGSEKIVHRDLATRNILVADENRVKISDFGLAQCTGKSDYYILQTIRDLPINWYAPESLRDGKFSSLSDVWSFGVTLYETFSLGKDPKLSVIELDHGDHGNHDVPVDSIDTGPSSKLLAALERGIRLPCPSTCPQTVYVKLMHPCWNLESHNRPDFATLCQEIKRIISEC